ncbi:Clathrin light chain [Tieghemiomyces parasiticus]|uniref:Clathrin light chain n=1 Tax=Tieghemiomyces parasiticus TaxID=78921 RepID=A0A9W8AH75_9FUNG|nr:Clathrin light chain [Tieghemiomyces parasiticus]
MSDLFSFGDEPAPSTTPQAAGDDPTADFLARERAVLGDDADFLNSLGPATGGEAAFGGFGDASFEPNPLTQGSPFSAVNMASPPSAFPETNHTSPGPSTTDAAQFAADFPDLDAPAGHTDSPALVDRVPDTESDFIRDWRQKMASSIEERDRVAQEKHEETLQRAIQDIDNFYEEYNTKKEQAITHNRANEKFEIQQANTGSAWERVYRQIDLATGGGAANKNKRGAQGETANGRDTTRMRELIADLRKDGGAPGNTVPENAA